MMPYFVGFLTCLSAFFRSRYNLDIAILALRQQFGVLKRKHPRPRLRIQDRIFWILLRRLWPAWGNVLVVVEPETVVACVAAPCNCPPGDGAKTLRLFMH